MTRKKVIIIDYNLGNLFSVMQACDVAGIHAKISNKKNEIEQADAIIIPGVGAFKQAMNNLNDFDLVNTIKNFAKSGKPVFGICLGLQLLFSSSDEFENIIGLDLIKGTVNNFKSKLKTMSTKIPQIGWNQIYNKNTWQISPMKDIEQNEYMYFVHSYFVQPENVEQILSFTNYEGLEYCSSILHNNIFAVQFHPEKSAKNGISIYKNWAIINNLI
jgi:glutamine amidotransferase